MIKAPNWCKNALMSTRGWVDPESGELLVSRRFSRAEVAEYNGQTEEAVRAVFAHARSNSPCILFFDDFDALGCKRASPAYGNDKPPETEGASHDLGSRVLSTFLNELDGVTGGGSNRKVFDFFEESSFQEKPDLVVIVACSSIDSLDDALIRPGRLSHHFHLDWPSIPDCIKILMTKLKGMPVDIAADDVNDDGIEEVNKVDNNSAINPLQIIQELAYEAIEHHGEGKNITASSILTCSENDENMLRCQGLSGSKIDSLCQNAVSKAIKDAITSMRASEDTRSSVDVSKLKVERKHFITKIGEEKGDTTEDVLTAPTLEPFVFKAF